MSVSVSEVTLDTRDCRQCLLGPPLVDLYQRLVGLVGNSQHPVDTITTQSPHHHTEARGKGGITILTREEH